ncbi:MAG: hypothetical protein U1E65_12605 [Myxococcota bacterium]
MSAPPSPSKPGFSGLRLSAVVFAWALFPAAVGAGVAILLADTHEAPELRAELLERQRAGALALDALQALQAQNRALRTTLEERAADLAMARALRAALEPEHAGKDVHKARVELSTDRILDPIPGVDTASLSVAFPGLMAPARAAPNRAAISVSDAAVTVLAPEDGSGSRWVATAPIEAMPPAPPDATSALVSLAAPLPEPASTAALTRFLAAGGGAFFAGILGAWVVALWAKRRFSAPLEAALDAASSFAHGTRAARADVTRGGADARDIALTLNGLIESLERDRAQIQAQADGERAALLATIDAFGRGDLGAPVAARPGALEQAFARAEQARQSTVDRLLEITRAGHKVAIGARTVAQGLHASLGSSKSSIEVASRLAAAADEAAQRMALQSGGVVTAIEELSRVSGEQKRFHLRLRADLTQVSRKAADVAQVADLVDARSTDTRSLDEALDLLTSIAGAGDTVAIRGIGGASVPSSQVILTARRSRTALEELRNELSGLSTLLTEVAHTLNNLGAQTVASPGEAGAKTSAILGDHAATLVRTAESLIDGLRAIERNARAFSDGAIEILAGAEQTEAATTALSESLLSFDLGPEHDETLVRDLTALAREMGEGSMSRDGQLAIAALARQAEEARARLGRMIAAAESARDQARS